MSIFLKSCKIYTVCKGEVDLSVPFPDRGTNVKVKGYLCDKRHGNVANVC